LYLSLLESGLMSLVFSNQMESDDLTPRIPRKRSRSPTPSIVTSLRSKHEAEALTHIPKRQRRAKDVPAYDPPIDATSISRNNPMSRKVLKKEAKKARRDATRAHKASGGVGWGMDVDGDEGALQFTFIATTEGVSF
jgi:nuclear GTP-binding protein